jgi:hypothetical protein
MAEQFELTDEMRALIGRQSPAWTFEVTTTSVRAFARGVGYDDAVYFDVDEARTAGHRSLPVPPTYIGTPVFIPGKCDDTFSNPRLGGPGLRHGLKGLLDGGTETEYLKSICAGDVLTAVSEITSLDVRTSPKLGKMLLVSSLATYRNEENEIVALQRSQAIYY